MFHPFSGLTRLQVGILGILVIDYNLFVANLSFNILLSTQTFSSFVIFGVSNLTQSHGCMMHHESRLRLLLPARLTY